MVEEKDILDNDLILEVLENGVTVWQKVNPDKDDQYTIKLLYDGKNYKFYKDGPMFFMKELVGAMPDFSDVPDSKDEIEV